MDSIRPSDNVSRDIREGLLLAGFHHIERTSTAAGIPSKPSLRVLMIGFLGLMFGSPAATDDLGLSKKRAGFT
jgi:hypothetical protein